MKILTLPGLLVAHSCSSSSMDMTELRVAGSCVASVACCILHSSDSRQSRRMARRCDCVGGRRAAGSCACTTLAPLSVSGARSCSCSIRSSASSVSSVSMVSLPLSAVSRITQGSWKVRFSRKRRMKRVPRRMS